MGFNVFSLFLWMGEDGEVGRGGTGTGLFGRILGCDRRETTVVVWTVGRRVGLMLKVGLLVGGLDVVGASVGSSVGCTVVGC